MPSVSARLFAFFLRTFEKPAANSSLEKTVAWFRKMNVHTPLPAHVHFCRLQEEWLGNIRYHYIFPKVQRGKRLLLYLHGGSYVGGPHLLQWSLAGRMAKAAGCPVVLLHYKLAPEHPFPAAFKECLRLYEHLQQEHPELEISFMGDSAGAGLGLGTCLKLKDQQKKLPAKLVLLSPWLDVQLQNPAITPLEGVEAMLVRKGVQAIGQRYAGTTAADHPYISPLYGELAGLPPLFLAIGTHDIFYPDCLLFRQKAQQAGVALAFLQEEGLFHDWAMFPLMPESARAIAAMARFVEA
ncbi:alpha/beta hydrolase [Cesiribacter andamanensis]|uniref:Monoterpene epsilon-lactone hydrolase n=1 Tax=Cesiribacter andamanensis AMV16 TaxID=1279009 RepID=M7NKG8_9BACT|nr:alpha/beta hydrolase [Cesiribacter andamanensis]EMR02255.1 Monoterpene epsilon-lactone hydrolase [Cesiribacter andamanensis AMV16]